MKGNIDIQLTGITHHLKTVQPYYEASESGLKLFEIRKDDRGYQVGDILHLYEWDGEKSTGACHYKAVVYILRDKPYVPDGYVCMSVWPISQNELYKIRHGKKLIRI
jgi:hypothetical protein